MEFLLTAFWIPKDRKKKEIAEAEFYLLAPEIRRTCKRKRRSRCIPLDSIIHQDPKKKANYTRTSWAPRKYWNYGDEFDLMMSKVKPAMRSDYRKRLYRWVVRHIPHKRILKHSSKELLDDDFQDESTVPYEPPIGSLKPIKVRVLELFFYDRGPAVYFVLDLKL